ncbi:MAG: glycosyltransferase family 4 protein [Paucibacter sp.]|nr:glycosyltransferase family 4 protein [Roseateles sp.]
MVTEDIPAPQVGGLGKHVVTLANHLIEAGHDVTLLGRSDIPYERYAGEIGFKGRFVAGFRMDRNGWKESKLGVWMPLKRAALARRIERSIAERMHEFDVVHYHGHQAMVGLGLPRDLPFLQSRHDQGSECMTHLRFVGDQVCRERNAKSCARCAAASPNPLQTWVSMRAVEAYRRSVATNFAQRKTLFVSNFLRKQFELAVPNASLEKSEVVHNFIDLARLNKNVGSGRTPLPRRVLMAGRVDSAKGFAHFLDVWQGRPVSADIVIVGDGPLLPEIRARHEHLATFVGWKPYDEVVAMTWEAHVCVMPSIWEEPFGTTTLEALAAGRPCLALRRGGTPEMKLLERYAGQLKLADTMEELVEMTQAEIDKPVRQMPAAASLPFDVSAVVPRIVEIYGQVRADAQRSANS